MKNKISRIVFAVAILLISLSLSGCIKVLSSTEYGAEYSRLPWGLGGFQQIHMPGSLVVYSPFWTDVYVQETEVRTNSYARRGKGDRPDLDDAINTRASDGNEIWLDITTQNHKDPLKIRQIIEKVGPTVKDSDNLTEAFAEGKIRAHLGELLTENFYDNTLRYKKIGDTMTDLNEILGEFGHIMNNVIIDKHRFSTSYQNLIDLAKENDQKAQKAKNNIETVRSDKKKELQDMIGVVNKKVEDAKGKFKQAKSYGDNYVKQKTADADAILVQAKNTAKATTNEINALRQAGSDAVVRLVIGKALIESQAEFVLINTSDTKGGINLTKTDNNDLLEKFGILSIFDQKPVDAKPTAPALPSKK